MGYQDILKSQQFGSGVCLLVASEIAWCAEGLEAVVAGVGFVLDVGHPVVVEVRAGGEALSTRLALVRSFPRVDPSVCVQGGAGGEGLVAELTRVRSLPRVGPHVSLEQGGPVEHLATVGTGDRLLTQPGHPLRLLGLLGTGGGGGLVFAAGASVSPRGEGVGWGGEEGWEGRAA